LNDPQLIARADEIRYESTKDSEFAISFAAALTTRLQDAARPLDVAAKAELTAMLQDLAQTTVKSSIYYFMLQYAGLWSDFVSSPAMSPCLGKAIREQSSIVTGINGFVFIDSRTKYQALSKSGLAAKLATTIAASQKLKSALKLENLELQIDASIKSATTQTISASKYSSPYVGLGWVQLSPALTPSNESAKAVIAKYNPRPAPAEPTVRLACDQSGVRLFGAGPALVTIRDANGEGKEYFALFYNDIALLDLLRPSSKSTDVRAPGRLKVCSRTAGTGGGCDSGCIPHSNSEVSLVVDQARVRLTVAGPTKPTDAATSANEGAPLPPPAAARVRLTKTAYKEDRSCGGAFGCNEDPIIGAGCSAGYHRKACKVSFYNPDKGDEAHCSANDQWYDKTDEHDCRCRVHLGAKALKAVTCHILIMEEQD